MFNNRTLKFALPALLLSASLSAYAQEEVSLNGVSTPISWANFVTAINTNSFKAPAIDPETDSRVKTEYEAVQTAQEDVNAKKSTLDTKKGVLDATGAESVQGKLDAAKTALQNYIKGLETAHNTAVSNLATKQAALKKAQTEQGTLQSDLTKAQGKLSDAKTELQSLQNQLNALPKKTETETIGWLQTIYNTAATFQTNYKGMQVDSPTIYYILETTSGGWGAPSTTTLTLSFSTTKPTAEGDWKELKPSTYYSSIVGNANFPTINTVEVYMGSDYAAKNNNNPLLNVDNYQGNKDYILQLAVGAVKTLTSDGKYQVTTTTDEVQDAYKTREATLKTQIAAAQEDVTEYTREIYGYHPTSSDWVAGSKEITGINEQLTTIKGTISSLQEDIDELNDSIPTLKANWDAAVNGTSTVEEYTTLKGNVTTAQDAVDAAQTAVDNAQKDYDDAQAALTKAQTDLNNAVATAQAADDAAVKESYNDVTLLADITASTPITASNYTGFINANNKVITVKMPAGSTQTALFNRFNGTLSNAAINGAFAGSYANATFDNVAVNAGDNVYRFYDDHGKQPEYAISSISELGYLARAFAGVVLPTDDKTPGKLVARTDASKVYSISIYETNTTTQKYVQVSGSSLIAENATNDGTVTVTIPKNRFAVSATSDIKTFTNLANVIYKEGANNNCQKVVITDKENFYCPVEINTAYSVSYNREFKAGANAVCLPFAINKSLSADITYLCTYNKEKEDKDGKITFWFTNTEDEIPANTPVLLVAENAFSFDELTKVAISATSKQVVTYAGATAGSSNSYGTFKSANRDEFAGGSDGDKIYGLTGDKFQLASKNATFPAFRMAIEGTEAQTPAQQQAPRYIGIQDEFGNVIVDKFEDGLIDDIISGVENVKSDVASIDVKAGQGEIIITSEADYGDVVVYTIDGKVVAKTTIVAGTNNIDVEKGIYIVLGKKVMVK